MMIKNQMVAKRSYKCFLNKKNKINGILSNAGYVIITIGVNIEQNHFGNLKENQIGQMNFIGGTLIEQMYTLKNSDNDINGLYTINLN